MEREPSESDPKSRVRPEVSKEMQGQLQNSGIKMNTISVHYFFKVPELVQKSIMLKIPK
jgi:hypothetical protein